MRRLKLIDDWHRVMLRAWSVRLSIIAIGLELMDALLPQLTGILPDRLLSHLSIVATIGVPIARLIQQSQLKE